MKILGIDPSLTSTGLCALEDGEVVWTHTIKTYDLRGTARLRYIQGRIRWALYLQQPDLVVMEDYAMGIKGGRVFSIGEMGGAIKMQITILEIDAYLVSPSSMKKFVTGKGNATKTQIHDALLMAWDIGIEQEDEADACGLALFGHYIKHPRLRRMLTDAQQEALEKYEILK